MAAEKQRCMIIGASPMESGAVFKEYRPEDYYVICADAGYKTAFKYGIAPDLIVGDFDSAIDKPPTKYKSVTLPVKKDVTDTMYAAIKGLSRSLRDFVLLGCLGGPRFDHSIANLEVLQYLLRHGARGVLSDEHTKVFLLRGGRLKMSDVMGATVSVFPYACESCSVSLSGLLFPLNHGTLTVGGLLMGVSNSVTADTAEILVHSGTALVIVYQE